MAEVDLENVTKLYPGGVRAVDSMSLRIGDREFVTLVGPSGCGKSTTLRMIAGLEKVTSGKIRIAGQLVNDAPPQSRDVAMVFQNGALYPHMNVFGNLAFSLKLRRWPRKDIGRKVRWAAELLGIERLLARKPKALSGGELQRVALGRAIVRRPKAFLLDEPLSNLDAKLRVEMRAELKKLHRRLAATTIYVTHDQEEAMSLGNRVVVLKEGVVQQCATPLEVYHRPVNRFVAGFIGMPPMNFLQGRILAEDGRLCFDEGSSRLDLPARLARALAGRRGQDVVLGIRPGGLSIADPSEVVGQRAVLRTTISLLEPLGDKIDIYLRTLANQTLVASVKADRSFTDGMKLLVHLNMDQVHVFEPGDEGVNVGLSDPGEQASAF